MVPPEDIYGGQDCDNDPGKQSPELGQYHSDLNPASDGRLRLQPVSVLQIQQRLHQPRRSRRPYCSRRKEPHLFLVEPLPVDQGGQPWAKKVILFRCAWAALHGRTEIAGFPLKLSKILHREAKKLTLFRTKSIR